MEVCLLVCLLLALCFGSVSIWQWIWFARALRKRHIVMDKKIVQEQEKP